MIAHWFGKSNKIDLIPSHILYTMEYYSAIKKNEIMSSAATRMDLEIVILSEASQKRRNVV